ncbi:hypothetical protein NpNSSI1_00006752 [Neofusicoccum parvum]|nr:hypothetical protein NpNSSI1_00006752 [Neofusicoccum parvum]
MITATIIYLETLMAKVRRLPMWLKLLITVVCLGPPWGFAGCLLYNTLHHPHRTSSMVACTTLFMLSLLASTASFTWVVFAEAPCPFARSDPESWTPEYPWQVLALIPEMFVS